MYCVFTVRRRGGVKSWSREVVIEVLIEVGRRVSHLPRIQNYCSTVFIIYFQGVDVSSLVITLCTN